MCGGGGRAPAPAPEYKPPVDAGPATVVVPEGGMAGASLTRSASGEDAAKVSTLGLPAQGGGPQPKTLLG